MSSMKSASAERFAYLARGKKPLNHRQLAESIEANIRAFQSAVDRKRLRDGEQGGTVYEFITVSKTRG